MCSWCGRPFLLRDQRRGKGWPRAVLALVVTLALGATVAIAALGGAWPAAREEPASVAAPEAPVERGEPAAAAGVPSPVPEPEPTAAPIEYVRVTNTGGQGLILRQEPSTSAARVGARAENTLLQVVGPDQVVAGRVWRNVEDLQGHRGWMPAEFLASATPASASP